MWPEPSSFRIDAVQCIFKILFLLTIAVTPAFAEPRDSVREERQERRELRERREKVRAAMRKIDSCLQSGNLGPCLSGEDPEIQEAVLRIYVQRVLKGKKSQTKAAP